MKKFGLILFTFVISFLTFTSVHAASANISVSSNKTRVIVGETVTITVKISSSSPLGSWKFDVVPSSNLTLKDSPFGGMYVVDYGNASTKSKTYTFTFKATSSGTGSVSIKNSQVVGYDELSMSVTNGSTSFKTMTQAELEGSYSKNNYLSNLSVDGYTLTPSFDRDTLEYSLEVANDVTSIKVNATKADSTASVSGSGEVSVSEGVNAIKIVVTAQNGSTKTYTINVTVKELSPIEVTVDGKKYTVVRKKEFMPTASIYYEESTIKIGDEEVPSYHNSKIDYTLVGLKDESGNISLFVYNDGEYTKYTELSFNQIAILPLLFEDSMIPAGYEQVRIQIGDNAFIGYQKKDSFPIIYGLNIETGEKSLYQYDSKENTVQRFIETTAATFNENLYFYCAVGLFGVLILTYFIIIIVLIKNSKKKKEKLERTMKLEATMKLPDLKKEEVLNKTKVDIGGASVKKEEHLDHTRKLEQSLKLEEEKANLLGKTRYDIDAITSYKEQSELSKKELKKQKKLAKKENKKNKDKIDKDQEMADF